VQPYQFEQAFSQQDRVIIHLPKGYEVDELPVALVAQRTFGQYRSAFDVRGEILEYSRRFEITDIDISLPQLPELRSLNQQISEDERATVVLRKGATKPTQP
jgi:hypothetical protein